MILSLDVNIYYKATQYTCLLVTGSLKTDLICLDYTSVLYILMSFDLLEVNKNCFVTVTNRKTH